MHGKWMDRKVEGKEWKDSGKDKGVKAVKLNKIGNLCIS